MKLIVLVLLSYVAFSQDTTQTCFTTKQVNDIATGVKVLKYKLAYTDTLVLEQSKTIAFQESRLKLKDTTIAGLNKIIRLHETNENLFAITNKKLEQIIAAQRPSLFESPVLWAVIGLGTGYLLFH